MEKGAWKKYFSQRNPNYNSDARIVVRIFPFNVAAF